MQAAPTNGPRGSDGKPKVTGRLRRESTGENQRLVRANKEGDKYGFNMKSETLARSEVKQAGPLRR